MAMNLRLDPERERALAEEARRTNRSQADVIREALDAYLDDERDRKRRHLRALEDAGELIRPTAPYRRGRPYLEPRADWDWEIEREDRV